MQCAQCTVMLAYMCAYLHLDKGIDMALTESQKRANRKYNQTKVDTLYIRIPKGQKDIISKHAVSLGESLTDFVYRAIRETMERDLSRE